jgi:type IX secretion system PorP/SprF family membrane protein
MWNMMSVNPAYAGTKGGIHGVLLHRQQWLNVEGAPSTQNFTVHSPVYQEKMGLGLNIVNDRIGVTSRLNIQAAYSYNLKLEDSNLRFGLQGSISRWRNNWQDINTIDPNDPSFAANSESFLRPNFGVGAYWNNDRFFASAAVPHLINQDLSDEAVEAQLRRHLFASFGGLYTINDQLKFKPSVMVKFVDSAPLQADINAELIINDRIWVGASGRVWDGLVGMAQVKIKENFWIGYAFDYPLTEIRRVASGTHEIFISYTHFLRKPKIYSPRYF